ncbi:MAG TPA: heparinase II/III family protein, partial [Solirubrobacterales bacterium]|nr:heparinase II/III family protein [Solirubrobacterales bacterium]
MRLIMRHAAVLTDPDTYKPTNHGLFVDLGLTLLARQLDAMPASETWAELGRERFAETLNDRVVADEGFWLEHSAGYQILISRSLARFLEVPGNATPELTDLLRRMQDVVGWLRAPDGRIPQLGDSDLKRAPRFAEVRARDDRGVLELDDSGLAIVKGEDGGYLAVMSSYHSDAHKHSDALTFDLFDRDRRLITDTGLYHKDKDENFAFAHSERAHSVLTVDGEPFPRDGTGAFGSGIEQTGKGHGFAAILGTNPATEELGVDHQRLFVYEPGRVLVIVDRLRSGAKHRYARFLQFAPGVDVRRARGGDELLALSAPGFRGAVTTNDAGGERVELARGERDPLRGLTSPSFRRWVPRTTARLRSKGADLDLITTITLSGRPLEARLPKWEGERGPIRLDLTDDGKAYKRLEITEEEDAFEIGLVRRADR